MKYGISFVRVRALARAPEPDRAQCVDACRAWELRGLVALPALAIMVLKPTLPGL